MVRSIVFILVTSFAHPAAAADTPVAAIRIRIHDYANIDSPALGRAQHIVSRMYDAIGVRTEWLGSTRPLEDPAIPTQIGSTDLTIIVLTPEMASRRTIPEAVVGYAAVTRGEAGRIAFVIYDRVRNVARHADIDIPRVMGMVMAHEVGHLLLPNQSHSENGLMRGHWAATDFRHLDVLDLGFTVQQVEEIRQTIQASATIAAETPALVPPGGDKPVALLATIVD